MDVWGSERRVRMAVEALGAETDPSRVLTELSVGQRYRVRLACLLGGEDDFLLLDEPTNHLDAGALVFLAGALRARKGGVMVVTHDRALLADFAQTIVDLDPTFDGEPRVYGDGYAGYRHGRVAQRQHWEKEYRRQQAEHARLQESRRAAQDRLISGWRPEKGSPKHGPATRAGALVQSAHRRQVALEAHALTVPEPPQEFHSPARPTRAGVILLDVEDVSLAGRLSQPVTVALSRRGRLVVTGPNNEEFLRERLRLPRRRAPVKLRCCSRWWSTTSTA